MIKVTEEYKLIEAAHALRSVNPPAFDKFVLALRERYGRAAERCVLAAPEHTPRAQGRANELKEMADILADLTNLYARVQTHRAKKEIP